VPERIGPLAVSVAYRPAEGLAAGGDFYDVFELDDGSAAIVVGDVSGHGRDSLAPATFIRHMVRSYLEAGLAPRAAIQLAGNILDEQDRDEFATVVAAVHNPAAGTLSFATAGHPPPVVTGASSYEPLTVASSPPAGVGATTGLRQTTIALRPGSAVCFYTDGLTEARAARGHYGRTRLEQTVAELGAGAAAQDVIDEVARATTRVRDDVAVCVIRVDGGAAGGDVRVEEIEVTLSDLHTPRLQRFFDACGVRPDEAAAAIRTAAPHVAGLGSVLLRVRLAHQRSGVDVVPVAVSTRGAEVVPVRRVL
jgi:serine phosphatase RsbU (regulator of sigma subunit)